MTYEQYASIGVLGFALVLFAWGRFRYDIVALLALFAGVIVGVVPGREAFQGFGHPAVVTVAAVLILSRGLSDSGATTIVATVLQPLFRVRWMHISSLSGVAAVLSGFMNNVGALALLMPVAIRSAIDAKRSPSLLLMPLAFGSILGGLITLIGTPPNIIVATYRQRALGEPFYMFDFAPVGICVAVAGLLFVAIFGWRLIPIRRPAGGGSADAFGIEDYLAEAIVKPGSEAIGKTVRQLDPTIGEADVKVVGLIREERIFPAAPRFARLREGDVLLIEADPSALHEAVKALDLEIVDAGAPMAGLLESEDVALAEAVISPGSRLENRTVLAARLQRRHGVNLLAVSRQGKPYRGRLRNFRFAAGDVVLLQGESERLDDVVGALGCLPLARRGLASFGGKQKGPALAVGLFVAGIALGAFGILPIAVALACAALGMVLTGVLQPRQLYESVDWSVIVLLGALIPLGDALEASGATGLAADFVAMNAVNLPPWAVLTLILVVTMTVSDILNNAATAVVMAPLAANVANALDVNPDAYLMAVAVGASCAFLTPIGHQNNTLVMGPGGYRFGDYWRMGLPLECVIVTVAIPSIMLFWPL
ncbi:MAG: SLC13 family permease [Alphaproteobacteria bacterium]